MDERFIHNIEEDIKENGWRKWLCYLKFWAKNCDDLDKEAVEDLRDKIEYNYKKEEGNRKFD